MIAVLLLNLGGPDSISAVRPFLYNLFSDREIIRLGPAFMQKPLARLISTLRHKKTESYYNLIGGKSPILDITNAQAAALELSLNAQAGSQSAAGPRFRVFAGMRYWHPMTEEVVPRIYGEGIRKVIALTLYPHYSVATTGSSVSKLNEVMRAFPIEVFPVTEWYDHPLYIAALVEKIKKGMETFTDGAGVHLLFSAHSLPQKFIEDGDPYVDHISSTIREVAGKTGIPYDLSYQSKSGPVKWLGPSTDEMIHKLAGDGVTNLLVVPISFVSDHIETLYEIDIQYRAMAEKLGMHLKRTESLNTSPLFISALTDIALNGARKAEWTE